MKKLILFAILLYATPSFAQITSTVDANQRFQTIDGFGAATAFQCATTDASGECSGGGNVWTSQEQQLLYHRTSGIGLSLLRVKLEENGTFPYMSNVNYAKSQGAKIWLVPWSAPASMKSNGSITNGGNLLPASFQAWAQQMTNYVVSMQNAGTPIYALSVQNEPDQNATYESMLWTNGNNFQTFIRDNLCPTMRAAGLFDTKIMMPEQKGWLFGTGGEYSAITRGDVNTNVCVGIYANHGYNAATPGANLGFTTNPPLPWQSVWETEDSNLGPNSTGTSDALSWAFKLHNWMINGANAWHYWWGVDQVTATGQGLLTESSPGVLGPIALRYYYIGHYSKFIRPGMQRIAASGSTCGSGTGACIDAYTGYDPGTTGVNAGIKVVIEAQAQQNATQALTITLAGLQVATVTPYLTDTGANKLTAQTPITVNATTGQFTYSLCGLCIVTFVGDVGISTVAGWHKVLGTALCGGPENATNAPPNNFPNNLNAAYTSYGYNFAANCGGAFEDSSTAILDTKRNRIVPWDGGHNEYHNQLYSLEINNFGTSAPSLVRLNNPADAQFYPSTGGVGQVIAPGGKYQGSPGCTVAPCPLSTVEAFPACNTLRPAGGNTYVAGCTPTGVTPGSRHTFNDLTYIPTTDQMFSYGGGTAPQGNSSGPPVWLLNMNSVDISCSPTNTTTKVSNSAFGCDPIWTQFSPSPSPLGNQYNYVNWDPNHTDNIWMCDDNANGIFVWTISTNTWSTSRGACPIGNHSFSGIDPIHQYFVTLGSTSEGLHYFSTANPNATGIVTQTPTTTNCSGITAGGSGQAADNGQYPGLQWDPIDKMFRIYMNGGPSTGGQPIYLLDPATWTCYTEKMGTTQLTDYPQNTPIVGGQQGTFGHFQYSPQSDIFPLINDPNRDAWYLTPRRPGIDITNVSGGNLTNVPISQSQAFTQGDVPQFANASCTDATGLFTQIAVTQTDAKNRWPDGSLKFAVVSFILPSIAAGQKVLCRYDNQSTGNNTGFQTKAQMLAAGYNFDGQIQLTGTVPHNISARTILNGASTIADCTNTDPDGTLGTAGVTACYWLRGPVVTSVILEDRIGRTFDVNMDGVGTCPVAGGSNCPLHPIFEATFYPQTNQVELSYILENAWASTTATNSARDQTYAYTLTAGNTSPVTVYTQIQETVQIRTRWHHMFCTNGTGIGTQNGCDVGRLNVDHRWPYLAQTKLFPNFDPTLVMQPGSTTGIATPFNFVAAWNHVNTNKGDAPLYLTPAECAIAGTCAGSTTHIGTGADCGLSGVNCHGLGFLAGFHGSCGNSNGATTGDGCNSGASNGGMDDGGAKHFHGPFTTWDTVTLITQDPGMLNVVTPGNADTVGGVQYWFREADAQPNSKFFNSPAGTVPTKGRIISINVRTTLDTEKNNASSCVIAAEQVNYGSPLAGVFVDGGLDTSHWPETSFVAYMMSGRYNYYEQMLMQAANAIGNSSGQGPCVAAATASKRQGAIGYAIYDNEQDRAVVWAMREMMLGATVAVDGSPEQAYLLDKLRTNIASIEGSNNIPCNVTGTPVQVNYCSGTLNGNVAAWTHGNTVRNKYPYIGTPYGMLFSGTIGYVTSPANKCPTGTPGCSTPYSMDANFMRAYTAVTFGWMDDLGFCPHNASNVCPLVQWTSNAYINAIMDPTGPGLGSLGDYIVPTIGGTSSAQQGITNLGCASIPCSVASGSMYPYFGTAAAWPRPVDPVGAETGWGNSQCGDESYASQSIAGLSYGYNLTSTANSNQMGTYNGTIGYSGADAYNTARTILLLHCTATNGKFTQQPKWDIVPRTPSASGAAVTAPLAPIVTLTPTSLTYAIQVVNTTSSAQTVQLSNSGTATLTITSISMTGTNPTNFAISSNTCGASLAAGNNCLVGVTFTPNAAGAFSANLTFVTNFSGSPDNVPLSGTGGVPVASFSPTALFFGAVKVGNSVGPTTITLTNTGTQPMTISAIALTGTNASDFIQNNTCGATLGVGLSCTFNVTFTPPNQGLRAGNISVTSNTVTSPDLAPLTGVGFFPISGTGTISGAGTIKVQP